MADGSSYEIDISARSVGVDTSADELNQLASKLDAAGATSTKFDSAIERTKTLLAQASSAAQEAASAVAAGALKYAQLEKAADLAAKAVEKASIKGQDTTDLQAKAAAAAAALKLQGTALDELKAKATAASAAEDKLKSTLKSLEGAAKEAAKPVKQGAVNIEEMTALAKGSLGPMGGVFEKATLITKGLSGGGLAGAAIAAAAAFAVLTTAIISGYISLATFAVTSNKVAMERLNKATEKAKDNFAKLFSGVHVDKFVAGMEKVLSLFSESTNEANALKTMISALLNPLFDQSGPAASAVVAMFRGMILGALQMTIAAVKLRNALRDVIPGGFLDDIDSTSTAFKAGEIAAYALAGALGLLAVVGLAVGAVLAVSAAFLLALFLVPLVVLTGIVVIFAVTVAAMFALVATAVVVSMALVLWPFLLVGAAIYYAITRFDAIKAAVLDFAASATTAAGSLISGLVNGITSGAGAVYDAIKGLAAGAIGTLKSALGIHSPSTVFALAGSYTAEGYAQGVEGNDAPQSAVESMVSAPSAREARASGGSAGSGGKGGNTIYLTINAPDSTAQGIAAAVKEALTTVLEGDVAMLGGAVPA